MAGAEKLKEKILEEARTDADNNIRVSKEEAEKILNEARNKAAEKKASIDNKAEREATEKRSRLIAAAKLESRKIMLQAKQDMIDEALEKALEKLNNMPKEQYVDILAELILSMTINGEYEIILSENDKNKIGMDLTTKVNSALKINNAKAAVKLSSINTSINNGFILKQGDLEVNNSFEAVLKAQRDELEADVVKVLF